MSLQRTATDEKIRELAARATSVVAWYPHQESYSDGCSATVRGPFFRWFYVRGGRLGDPVADQYNDAQFAAAAMNNIVQILDEKAALERVISNVEKLAEELENESCLNHERNNTCVSGRLRDALATVGKPLVQTKGEEK